jgi:hypothetical protein
MHRWLRSCRGSSKFRRCVGPYRMTLVKDLGRPLRPFFDLEGWFHLLASTNELRDMPDIRDIARAMDAPLSKLECRVKHQPKTQTSSSKCWACDGLSTSNVPSETLETLETLNASTFAPYWHTCTQLKRQRKQVRNNATNPIYTALDIWRVDNGPQDGSSI